MVAAARTDKRGQYNTPQDTGTELLTVCRVSVLGYLLTPDPLFPGGPLQNGQPSAEIQEEVALTSLGSGPPATNKRHSTGDKMHFPRANLQPITTLGMWPCLQLPQFCCRTLVLRLGNGLRWFRFSKFVYLCI